MVSMHKSGNRPAWFGPCSVGFLVRTRAAPSAPRASRTASSDRAAAGHVHRGRPASAILASLAALDVFRAQFGIAIGTVAARRATVAAIRSGLRRRVRRAADARTGPDAADARHGRDDRRRSLAVALFGTASLAIVAATPGLVRVRRLGRIGCRRAFDGGDAFGRRSGDAFGGRRHAVRGGLRRGPRPARLATRPRVALRARRWPRERWPSGRPGRQTSIISGSAGAAAAVGGRRRFRCGAASDAGAICSAAASAAAPAATVSAGGSADSATATVPAAARRLQPALRPARRTDRARLSATSGVTSTAPASVIGASVATASAGGASEAAASATRLGIRRVAGCGFGRGQLRPPAFRQQARAPAPAAASAASPCDSRARAAPTRNPRPSSRRATSSPSSP